MKCSHFLCQRYDMVTITRNCTNNARELTVHSNPRYQLRAESCAICQSQRCQGSNGCNDKSQCQPIEFISKHLPVSAANIDELLRWQSTVQLCLLPPCFPNSSGLQIAIHLLFQSHLNILTYLDLRSILWETLPENWGKAYFKV